MRRFPQQRPAGVCIKRAVPNLRDITPAEFAAPAKPGLRLTKGYLPLTVDHAEERVRTLQMYRKE